MKKRLCRTLPTTFYYYLLPAFFAAPAARIHHAAPIFYSGVFIAWCKRLLF